MPTLSLCMIVKNEEKFLDGCLQSVREVADQMIIVDTGSTDNSVAIAKKYGAEVYHFLWQDDFSAARNEALKHANGDWILHLDADEVLDRTSAAAIQALMASKENDAYLVTVRNLHPAGDAVKYLDSPQLRLFRNHELHSYMGKIHEQIGPGIQKTGGNIHPSDLLIVHYGYRDDTRIKAERNVHLLENVLKTDPQDEYVKFKLAETYKALNLLDKSRKLFKEISESTARELSEELMATLFARLSQIELAANKYEQTIEYANRSLQINPQNVVALYVLSVALLYLGDVKKAESCLARLSEYAQPDMIDHTDLQKLFFVCKILKMKKVA